MPLLQGGCSQVGSQCLNASNGLCTRFLQTFSCMNQVCFPEKPFVLTKYPAAMDRVTCHLRKKVMMRRRDYHA